MMISGVDKMYPIILNCPGVGGGGGGGGVLPIALSLRKFSSRIAYKLLF